MKKIIHIVVMVFAVLILSSGSCDPARREEPYCIRNNSDRSIVFGYYYVSNTYNTKNLLTKWFTDDIMNYITNKPLYKPLEPNEKYTVLTIGSREDLLEDSANTTLFIWIQEEGNLEKLRDKKNLSFDDLDYFFLGTAEDLRDMNWEIIYHGNNEK